ncbi:MAG: hypothetical protein COT14_03260 [Candidatus Diapherotrites archaeon CG08_land_8_20_14_0_20_30_16]|nr:MAG: hypothetical protein COT14_03260 [Candidatus Diapherotrites archaeon CG08_land_8_20_14_0_20_30_16]
MQKEKDNKKGGIEKGDIVTLSYKLYDSTKKLIDECKEQQPLVIQYGKTVINKDLHKKLMGKKICDTVEIKQKLKTKPPLINIDFDNLEEEDQEQLETGQIIELNIKDKRNLFIVEKINLETGTILLKYKNPYENQTLTNIVKIEKIKKKVKI